MPITSVLCWLQLFMLFPKALQGVIVYCNAVIMLLTLKVCAQQANMRLARANLAPAHTSGK
jgi:hypothetical protein